MLIAKHKLKRRLCGSFLLSCLVLTPSLVTPQSVDDLKAGVVKITAQPPQGSRQVGTGFIVRVESDRAYIVTAGHVVAGDPEPKVEFFTKRHDPVPAGVLGVEGGDKVRGLALLVVRGKHNLPTGLKPLALAPSVQYSEIQEVTVIGFPLGAAPWSVIKRNLAGLQGRVIFLDPAVNEGNSGGPMLWEGRVVGLVTGTTRDFGRGVPAISVQAYVRGFDVAPRVAEAGTPTRQRPVTAEEITGKDGAPMVLVPAGEFVRGSPSGGGDDDEHPQKRIYLDAFYMDKYEVTTARYAKFLRATGRKKPRYWDRVNLNNHGDRPVAGVNWHDAKAYCEWAEKRLPTEAEWEKAARGTDNRKYPWGNEAPTSRSAVHAQSWSDTFYSDRLKPVDSSPAGKSPYGLHHMAGNVWEWVADRYGKNYYLNSPDRNPQGPSRGEYTVLRGGSWNTRPESLRSAYRIGDLPTLRFAGSGVRCAKDAP